MGKRYTYPKNKWISNSKLVLVYLFFLRKKWKAFYRPIELLLGSEIRCPLPERLFLPHPYGIIVGSHVRLGENVVLMHQVTLGGKDPHLGDVDCEGQFPTLEEGVYVGAGAKILGNVTVGRWSIVAANSVVVKSMPAGSLVAGVPGRVVKTHIV
jgi:serine O-acetyltransferase